MSNQYDTNEPSEESAVIDAVGSEKNVTDNSDDCSDVKASTSKIINKLVDLPKMTSETNVSHNSNDELCIKEFESTSESKTSKNDTNINSTEEKNQNHEYFVSSEPQDNNDTKKKIVESNHSHEYFVSSDPQENEDNNNPEWELLRKLETDEERYKAVRMRWKNLVIPNPNQNLSYRNEGITKPLNENPRTSRKRTLSDNSKLETNYKEQKRARTMSCTALFDQKVQKLHNSMNQTIRRIENNAHQAVHDLNFRETRSFMYRPPGSRAEEVYREAVHIQNIVELRRQYEMQVTVAMKEGEGKINALHEAMEEVHTFNSFYQGLEPGLENTIFLSASELEELGEEDKLYEEFNKFYK